MNQIICFDKSLLRSKAFRSLSKWSLLAYLDFFRKRQMEKVKHKSRSAEWIIKNNGEIVYPYTEAEHKGIGRREFRNAIDELIDVVGRSAIEAVLLLSAKEVAGEKHPGKAGSVIAWHGRQAGVVSLSNRKLRVEKPRLRKKGRGSGGEVSITLTTYIAKRW